jgi:Holliday junction resolvase
MAKQTKKTVRQKIGKQNKQRGNNFERKIVKDLKDLGFQGCCTSRSESKSTDDNKIDIIDKNKQLPFDMQIQTKKTSSTPSYFNIREQSTVNNEAFVII